MLVKAFSQSFVIALQMSLPVVGSIFLVDVTLGYSSTYRSSAKYICSWDSCKIIAGFLVLLIVMGMMMQVVTRLFEFLLLTMRNLMQLIGGG